MGYNVTAKIGDAGADREADQQALQAPPPKASATSSASWRNDDVAQGPQGPRRVDRPRHAQGRRRLQPRPQADQPRAAPGDQGQGLGHPLRAVRGRVQDALPHRRRALRDDAAAGAHRAGHQLAHQGHGEPRHRRAAHAAGRPHRAERQQPADRPARQRAADDVRRERRHARARPQQRQPRPRQARPARGRPRRHPPAHPQAQRHRDRHRPDRLGQDDHALLGPARAERHPSQADHRRGPGRVRHRRHHPVPDQAGHRADVRPHPALDAASGPGHRSWSAKSATRRRPRSPCRRR